MRGRALAIAVAASAVLATPAAAASRCPGTAAAGDFAGAKALRQLNAKQADFGARPTASPAHERFIDFIERKAERVDGVRVRDLPYEIERLDQLGAELRIGAQAVPLAGPAPFSAATPDGGVTAEVAYVGAGEQITPANAAGKIVAIEDPLTTYPASVFFPGALGVAGYTPRGISPDEPYTRDSRDEAAYLRAAQTAGAVGLVIIKDIPRDQVAGFYRPYSGARWSVPGAFVGVDEGERLRQAADEGAEATLVNNSTYTPASTRTVLASVRGPGKKPRRLLVESHTDGMNAVWDNGPVAMIAMLRYLADLPRRCRPGTVQFAFTTGHLYGSFGAEALAAKLDRQYDDGRVTAALALEHLGAKEYATVPRADGPGNRLELTQTHEPTIVAATQSAKLRALVAGRLNARRIDRTVLVTGTDPPVADRVPPNCSFGGEGTAYNRHLVPTIGVISGPRNLFTPGYGIESIDFRHMRAQTLVFTDVLLRSRRLSRAEIAGDVLGMREARAAGAPGCSIGAGRVFAAAPQFHCGLGLDGPAAADLIARARTLAG